MTRLDKLQLAVRRRITDISTGYARCGLLAASVAAGAMSFFPMGSFGYAVASTFNELSANSRTEEKSSAIRPFHGNFPRANLIDLCRRIVATRSSERRNWWQAK